MLRLAHIINPYRNSATGAYPFHQLVTFATMRYAAESATTAHVELLAAVSPEDRPTAPAEFRITRDLTRTVLDLRSFNRPRPLPLLRDVLDRAYESTNAEYLIYSNVDIGLMPFFYDTVASLIGSGIDALSITRRTIRDDFTELNQLPLMWAQAGSRHPGYDCFVFRRDRYPFYALGDTCLGMIGLGEDLLASMDVYADRFGVLRDLCVTFHLGDDRPWRAAEYRDYTDHNYAQICAALSTLDQRASRPRQRELIAWHRAWKSKAHKRRQPGISGAWARFTTKASNVRNRFYGALGLQLSLNRPDGVRGGGLA